MSDSKQTIEGMEQFKKCLIDILWFHGTYVNWEPFDACLALLKEQEARIEFLEKKLRLLEYGDQDTLESGLMPENLRAMCAPCHLRYDAQHHAETRRAKKRQ